MIFFMLMNPINDITTQFPPLRFEPVAEMEQASRNSYDQNFEAIQKKLYPDLKPLALNRTPEEVFEACLGAARSEKSWKLHWIDHEGFLFQGTDTTSLMKYRDDFVVRVEASEAGSVVQMRSRSRVGKSDLGKNADRIKSFFSKVQSQLEKK